MNSPRVVLGALTLTVTLTLAQSAAAQKPESLVAATPGQTFHACFVPEVGAVYLIGLPGLPAACLSSAHQPISWTDGVADGAIATAKLADLAVTTAKLADQAVTADKLAAELPAGPPGLNCWDANSNGVADSNEDTNGDGMIDVGDCVASGTDHGALEGLVDDDHPQYLLADGVRSTTGFAVTGTDVSGPIPVTGAGKRLMWYARKTAFRVGRVTGTQWDDVNVGENSVALGSNTTASGDYSTAIGSAASATGTAAAAIGNFTVASGEFGTAMGYFAKATGDFSVALGNETTASGNNSTALGHRANTSNRTGAFVYADASEGSVLAPADNSFTVRAVGGTLFDTPTFVVKGVLESTSGGIKFPDGTVQTTAGGASLTDHGTLGGLAADDHTQYLLADGIRSSTNGFAVSGTVGTGTIPVTGAGTRFMWYPRKSAFRAGHVESTQWDDPNVGEYSVALGSSTTASGDYSTALGYKANTFDKTGAFVYADASDPTVDVVAPADNSFTVRAAGGTLFDTPSFVVNGILESTSGGVKFPDGTVQTTAGGAGATAHGALTGLAEDDHAQYLLADGVRSSVNGFAVTASGSGTIPESGAGTRLMWYPGKAAFRAGLVNGNQWDDANIGQGSVALGENTIARGLGSAAFGVNTTAHGLRLSSVGRQFNVDWRRRSPQSYWVSSMSIGAPDLAGPQRPSFVVGNGTNAATPNNALALLKNGDLKVAGEITAARIRTRGVGPNSTGLGEETLTANTGFNNTASGFEALTLNTSGESNTGSGTSALHANTTGSYNTAVGAGALRFNQIGASNTGTGVFALFGNLTGSNNTATGESALLGNKTGQDNTASGYRALYQTQGNRNTALGSEAGSSVTYGHDNIFIANQGEGSDDRTIRVGSIQTRTFIAGINLASVGSAAPVFINSDDQLGTIASSRRYKEDIADIGELSARVLALRPVTFRYRRPANDGAKPRQFGLIAEEVAEVFPELAVYNERGEPESVQYHLLSSLLLNELKRQQRELTGLHAENRLLHDVIADLAGAVERLKSEMAASRQRK